MHGVSGTVGHHAAKDAMAKEREIADKIQHFMADEFIGKAERTVLHTVMGDNNGVFFARATDQTHTAEFVRFVQVSKGASGGDVGDVFGGAKRSVMVPVSG